MRFCAGLPLIWRGTSTQNDLPAGHGSCRRQCSRGGDLQGVGIQQARLLPVEGQSGDGTGLGRRASGQRRTGHPCRGPDVRVPVHRRRTPREGHPGAGENRVQRLCRDHAIWSVSSKKRGLNRKPGPPVHDNLVERDFTATAPNELWLTDITEHPTAEGKLYLCAVKDVYSGRIVGYSMDSRMRSSLAVAALENAVRARRPAGTVVHSDSETVRTGIPGRSLTRILMDATGCWCRVPPGVLDSHSDRPCCLSPDLSVPKGVPGEALRLTAGVT